MSTKGWLDWCRGSRLKSVCVPHVNKGPTAQSNGCSSLSSSSKHHSLSYWKTFAGLCSENSVLFMGTEAARAGALIKHDVFKDRMQSKHNVRCFKDVMLEPQRSYKDVKLVRRSHVPVLISNTYVQFIQCLQAPWTSIRQTTDFGGDVMKFH